MKYLTLKYLNWRQIDSIDAKDLTESTLQFSTEIQKSLSESLNSNFPAVVISYSCEDFAAVFDKPSVVLIKHALILNLLQWQLTDRLSTLQQINFTPLYKEIRP